MTVTTWTTEDGRVIPLVELTNSHLKNIILWMRRRCGARKGVYEAQMLLSAPPDDVDLTPLWEMPPREWCETVDDKYMALAAEAKRRELVIDPDADWSDQKKAVRRSTAVALRTVAKFKGWDGAALVGGDKALGQDVG